MKILSRYLISEISRYIFFSLLVVMVIYIAVDFIEKIDDFMEAGLPLSRCFFYFIFKIPFIGAQVFPVCLLLSVLVVFGLLNKNNELIALKSNGVSVYALFKPVFFFGVLMSLLLFILNEGIVPAASSYANQIWNGEVRNQSNVIIRKDNIWIKDNRRITHIKHYNPNDNTAYGISINYFDTEFKMEKRVDAQKGVFEKKGFVLYEVMEQNFIDETGEVAISFHDKMQSGLSLDPTDLKKVIKTAEEMSFTELYQYVNHIEEEGYDATTYKADLYAKAAFPFVCVILCMIGAGMSLRGHIREGITVSISYGIGISFLYWIIHSFSMSLAYGEMMPPFIAAFSADFIFTCTGAVLLINAE